MALRSRRNQRRRRAALQWAGAVSFIVIGFPVGAYLAFCIGQSF